MLQSERAITWLWLAGGVAGLILLLYFYPTAHPWSMMRLTVNSDSIRFRSQAVLADLHLDSVRFTILPRLRQSSSEEMGARKGPPTDAVPAALSSSAYHWRVRIFRADPDGATSLRISNSEERIVDRILKGDIQMRFHTDGSLLYLLVPVPDSVSLPSLSPHEALGTVERLIRTHADSMYRGPLGLNAAARTQRGFAPGDSVRWTRNESPARRNYSASWAAFDARTGDSIDVRVDLAGGTVTRFSLEPRATSSAAGSEGGYMGEILQVLFYVGLSILLIVTGIRRLRAYEIGFRTALLISGVTALLFGTWFYLQLRAEAVWEPELLFPLLLAPLLVGGAMFVVWAVGESVGRETWKEKFITVDLLTRGHVLHSRIGHALLRGLSGGLLMTGIGVTALGLFAPDGGIGIVHKSDNAFDMFSSGMPALFVLGDSLNSGVFAFAFAVMFVVSLVRQRLRTPWLLLPMGALVLALPNPLALQPLWSGIALTLLPALVVILLFVSADVMAGISGLSAGLIVHKGGLLLLPWNTAYQSEGMLLLAVGLAMLLFAVLALVTRDTVSDFEKIAPRFQRHISERQRLSRELEIARDVQMGFLPKHDPHFPGLDIASRCAPAMEVGGDYYDFIDLGPDKIGIAIGDVSGKGTQAAFYMTLTKGFLKALGRFSTSPSRVLVEMNRLFYENVERGNFISMIYAVFDLKTHSVTIARAGHTPVMRMDSDHHVDVIQSRGMALGFEGGEKFEQTIEEVTLPIHPGDIFVLYTDGYPEAMTTKREEFGEERLAVTLQRHAGDSAAQILDGLYRETRRFAGKAEQHDDMTMVVVRVS
ncbi:MAG: PP2C family protein-serine/threonine phosphatase [Bacteroidia bacterium]|nr:PP2C family protein-serine/threonine phosphatase [Bacteroidia bacterium]